MPTGSCIKPPDPPPPTAACQVWYKQPGPPPPTASCYICLENSADRKPLLRNCACRGDAGWAHVTCLAEFAASKVTEAQQKQDFVNWLGLVNVGPFWEHCILCKTPYMQNVGAAMAEAFVKQYAHLPDTNQLRFLSLYALAKSRFDVNDHDGGVELYNRLLKMCNFMTSKGIDVRCSKSNVLSMMGTEFMVKQQFDDALPIFEQIREIVVAVYGPNSPEVEENNEMIVLLKEKIGIGGRDHQQRDMAAELIRARERFRKNQGCGNTLQRLSIHSRLVDALRDDGRHQEAMEQLEKVLADSIQSLGPNHPNTHLFEHDMNLYRQKMLQFDTLMASNSSAAGVTASEKKDVWAVIDCEQQPAINGQRVQVLRATKDARKYVCLIKNDKGVSTKFKAAPNQFILETETTVVVHGLVSSTDLNGIIGRICSFDKEKRRYAVSVEIKKTYVSIKPINLNIVFT